MLETYVIVALVLLSVYLGCRVDYWKSETKILVEERKRIDDDKAKVEKELSFHKDTIVSLYNKQILITLNDIQLEVIAQRVSDKMKEPKPWLN